MLGNDQNNPALLVDVKDDYDPKDFKFTVINGGWSGMLKDSLLIFKNGEISLTNLTILTDNQDRLRCGVSEDNDYNTVFDNFHNLNYVAPQIKHACYNDEYNDDIPF
jgi:hypothetical protein